MKRTSKNRYISSSLASSIVINHYLICDCLIMEDNDPFLNYYEALQCDRTASSDELKKSYQRLVLTSHPDKSDRSEDKFLLIQKAWSVLRDPESRKQYDATLTCHEHNDHLLYDTIKLSDMMYNEVECLYSYCCRCGGVYLLNAGESIPSKVVIGCDECSFSIQVNR